MSYLSHIGIVANVRPDGSMGEYKIKTFDLMLCSLEDKAKQIKEAKRILRQIGYQVKSAQFELDTEFGAADKILKAGA